MASNSSRRGFFSLLNLLLALFLAVSLVSAAAHGEGADIASALLAAADGDSSIEEFEEFSDLDLPDPEPTGHKSTSTSLTNIQAASMNTTKQKGYAEVTNTSTSTQQQKSGFKKLERGRPTSVMGMAAVVPICAIFITLAVVAMRLYLNRIEEEEEYLLEKKPWRLDPNDERFEIGGYRKGTTYAGPMR